MTAAHSLLEAEAQQKLPQLVGSDVGIGPAEQYLLQQLGIFAHRPLNP